MGNLHLIELSCDWGLRVMSLLVLGCAKFAGSGMDISKGRGRRWLVPAGRGMFSTVLCATSDFCYDDAYGFCCRYRKCLDFQDLSRSE